MEIAQFAEKTNINKYDLKVRVAPATEFGFIVKSFLIGKDLYIECDHARILVEAETEAQGLTEFVAAVKGKIEKADNLDELLNAWHVTFKRTIKNTNALAKLEEAGFSYEWRKREVEEDYEEKIFKLIRYNKKLRNVMPITETYMVHKVKHKYVLEKLFKKADGTVIFVPVTVVTDYTLKDVDVAKILNVALKAKLAQDKEWEEKNK